VLRTPGEDRPGREGSRVAIGQTRAGRYLRVIYVPDLEPDSIFVITAYQVTGKPLMAYRDDGGRNYKKTERISSRMGRTACTSGLGTL
jgi:hypothetical protein